MTQTKEIDVARNFTPYPVGRTRSDGRHSGEAFRDDYLVPALKAGAVTVAMDGAKGYGSSFLEETFGGLVRRCGFEANQLGKRLVIKTEDALLSAEIWGYVKEADELKAAANVRKNAGSASRDPTSSTP